MAQDYEKGVAAANAGDYAKALKEWRPLAEAGDRKAQYSLGVIYNNGDGIPQDYGQSAKWWKLAAEQGSAAAQNILGLSYILGEGGVGKDLVLAHMWLNIAATNGNDTAAKMRKNVTEQMTPAALVKAQTMARECMESNYKECG